MAVTNLVCSDSDLGTTLSKLTVIWLNRCGLSDLDGLVALPLLKVHHHTDLSSHMNIN